MLTVWGRASSSNVQAVLWCVAELGIEHERIEAGFTYGVVDTPDYLAMNPNGTVPTVRDGGSPIWETGAILRYLAGSYGDERFWPRSPGERAQVDKWAEWSKVNAAASFTAPVFWRVVRTPAARRDPEAIRAAVLDCERVLGIADAQLARSEYLAGEHLTLADIQLGHVLYRYHTIDIERAGLRHLRRYYDALTERPAYRSTVMVSYAELADSL